jgi:hypothetical protein
MFWSDVYFMPHQKFFHLNEMPPVASEIHLDLSLALMAFSSDCSFASRCLIAVAQDLHISSHI